MRPQTRSEVIARRLASVPSVSQVSERSAVVEPQAEAAPVPVPGRHAERRRWVPVTLRGPIGLEPWHGVVLAALLVVVAGLCCWWLLHRVPDVEIAPGPAVVPTAALTPVAAPAVGSLTVGATGPTGATGTTGATGATGATPGVVTVDVAGKVRRPGVHRLPAGSRVVDALRAAGGARRGVSLTGLNQARVLVDGEQILVGASAALAPAGTGSGAVTGGVVSGATGAGALVNLNTATLAELDTLPGVGPVTAQSILDYRSEHGGFSAVAELLEVDGIGPATLADLEPRVTV